jgi:hypothetical protein
MRRFLYFWWQCASMAARGNAAFANSWMWLFGIPVFSTLLAYIASRQGVTTVTTGSTVLDLLLTGAGSFAATWVIAFIVRLAYAPAQLYHAEKERADHFERVRSIANGGHEPSFKLGFEVYIDKEAIETYHQYKHISSYLHKIIFRIYVENIDRHQKQNTSHFLP